MANSDGTLSATAAGNLIDAPTQAAFESCCCGAAPEPGTDCGYCAVGEAPLRFTVVFSGITACASLQCPCPTQEFLDAKVNGQTFVLVQTGEDSCIWTASTTGAEWAGNWQVGWDWAVDVTLQLVAGPPAHAYLTIAVSFASCGAASAPYYDDVAGFSCTAGAASANELVVGDCDAGPPIVVCDGYGGSATITPGP